MGSLKSVVAPIIAVIAIALQLVFGVEIPEELQNNITDAIINIVLVGTVVYGIITNHTKNKDKEE